MCVFVLSVCVCGEEWGRRESKYEAFLRPYARPAEWVEDGE